MNDLFTMSKDETVQLIRDALSNLQTGQRDTNEKLDNLNAGITSTNKKLDYTNGKVAQALIDIDRSKKKITELERAFNNHVTGQVDASRWQTLVNTFFRYVIPSLLTAIVTVIGFWVALGRP